MHVQKLTGQGDYCIAFTDSEQAHQVKEELEMLVLQRAAAKETEKTGQTDGQTA